MLALLRGHPEEAKKRLPDLLMHSGATRRYVQTSRLKSFKGKETTTGRESRINMNRVTGGPLLLRQGRAIIRTARQEP